MAVPKQESLDKSMKEENPNDVSKVSAKTSKTNKSKNDKSMVSDKVFITPGAPTPKPDSSRRPSTTSNASKKPESVKKEVPQPRPSIPSPAKS